MVTSQSIKKCHVERSSKNRNPHNKLKIANAAINLSLNNSISQQRRRMEKSIQSEVI